MMTIQEQQALRDTAPGVPLTCQHCRRAPVTRLLVADLADRRLIMLLCEPCASRDAGDAKWVAKASSAVWLFALTAITETPEETTP